MALIRGIDVSVYQGVVPWAAVAAEGVRFAFLRCSVGNEPRADVKFAENVAKAKEQNIAVAPYHFSYPLKKLDPVLQAQHAFKMAETNGRVLGQDIGDMPPALDVEWPPRETRLKDGTLENTWKKWDCSARQIFDWNLACAEEMERLWGVKPVIYTYRYFWKCLTEGLRADEVAVFDKYVLWLADYTMQGRVPGENEKPKQPAPWTDNETLILQHDGDGGLKLPNGQDADYNVLFGGEEAFARLTGQPRENPVDVVDLTAAKWEALGILSEEMIRSYRQDRINEEL